MKLQNVGKSNQIGGKQWRRRALCLLLVFVMVLGSFGAVPINTSANDGDAYLSQFEAHMERLSAFSERYHFTHFLRDHGHLPRPDAEYIIDAASFTLAEGMDVRLYDNFEGVEGTAVWTDEVGLIEWEVNVAQSGLYNLSVLYYTVEGRSSAIQRAIFINGEQPFFEANPVEFPRTWVNQHGTEISRDAHGNDMRPTQVEYHRWYEAVVRDAMGTYNEDFVFYLQAGRNTIGFVSQREPMKIRHLRIHQVPVPLSYAQLSAERAGLSRPTTAQVDPIRVEGQDAIRKSSPMLAPQMDTSGPGVYPYDSRFIRVNHIGGYSWREPGSWIEWRVYVPVAGLYNIALNVRQNLHRGANAVRRVTINGEVPFTEMEAVNFAFQSNWRVEYLGGDEPFLFWLEEGYNYIRMEAVLGAYAPLMREVQEAAENLNALYRDLVVITGHTPDIRRDYRIRQRLPHMEDALRYERVRLDRVFDELSELTEGRGERDAVIRSIARLITRLYEDVEQMPRRMVDFRINIGSLGTWLMMTRSQQLAVESIHVLPYDAPTPTNGRSWWRQIWHEIVTLFWSFIIDYNSLGTLAEDGSTRNIEVWVGTGRDQANVIKGLIDETFTRDTGIGVTFKLVDMGTLLPATVARQGPDVALTVGTGLPVDFAVRGAVADISGFPGFEEVAQRFHPAAMVPFTFNDQVFALPETFTFPMMFYRRDILHEIGLELPNNWDEVRSAIAHLAPLHMDFGLPAALAADFMYTMFLYQAGGTWYNEDATRSALHEDVAVNAFRDYTRFYTDYQLPREFDFMNRFRVGEMPIAVVDYTTYNALQVFAPEIRGLWGFRPVPGTIRPDGTFSNVAPTGGMAVVMMEHADDKDAAWEFMKWWTSAEVQMQFGRRMESLMGSAARFPTANLEAFSQMPWPIEHYRALREQMDNLQGIPQVPGGYFTGRYIRNAFFTTVEVGVVGPREALTDVVRQINSELTIKRREFGLHYYR